MDDLLEKHEKLRLFWKRSEEQDGEDLPYNAITRQLMILSTAMPALSARTSFVGLFHAI